MTKIEKGPALFFRVRNSRSRVAATHAVSDKTDIWALFHIKTSSRVGKLTETKYWSAAAAAVWAVGHCWPPWTVCGTYLLNLLEKTKRRLFLPSGTIIFSHQMPCGFGCGFTFGFVYISYWCDEKKKFLWCAGGFDYWFWNLAP